MGHEHYTSLDQAGRSRFRSHPRPPPAADRPGRLGPRVRQHRHRRPAQGLHRGLADPDHRGPVHVLPRGLRAPAPRAAGRGGARGRWAGATGPHRPRAVPPSTLACRPTCSSAAARPRNVGWPSRADARAELTPARASGAPAAHVRVRASGALRPCSSRSLALTSGRHDGRGRAPADAAGGRRPARRALHDRVPVRPPRPAGGEQGGGDLAGHPGRAGRAARSVGGGAGLTGPRPPPGAVGRAPRASAGGG